MRETGFGETAVKQALHMLEDSGFISAARLQPSKNGYVNVWELNGVALRRGLDTTGSLYVPQRGRSTTGTGSRSDGDGVASRPQNSLVELSRELVNENSSDGSDDAPHGEAKAESTPKTSVPKIPVKIKVQAALVEQELEHESRLCAECCLYEAMKEHELCLQCRLATVEVSDMEGI